MYTLYLLESPTNKKYIGATSKSVEERWNNGTGHYLNKKLHNDIKKYGWENFKHEILFDNLTKEEADWMEKFYIALYNTTDSNCGYNISTGGKGGRTGVPYTKEEPCRHAAISQEEYIKRKNKYFKNKGIIN